jgi:hypothetical protein
MVMAVPLLNNKHLHKKKNNSSQGSIVELLCLNKNSTPIESCRNVWKVEANIKASYQVNLERKWGAP